MIGSRKRYFSPELAGDRRDLFVVSRDHDAIYPPRLFGAIDRVANQWFPSHFPNIFPRDGN
jgi:hypothetical protein